MNSIGGLRKQYYLFKKSRRELLGDQDSYDLTEAYIKLCSEAINSMKAIRLKNLGLILFKLGVPRRKFDQSVVRVD